MLQHLIHQAHDAAVIVFCRFASGQNAGWTQQVYALGRIQGLLNILCQSRKGVGNAGVDPDQAASTSLADQIGEGALWILKQISSEMDGIFDGDRDLLLDLLGKRRHKDLGYHDDVRLLRNKEGNELSSPRVHPTCRISVKQVV